MTTQTATLRTTDHGELTVPKADLRALAKACAEPTRHGLNVVLWERTGNPDHPSRLVATNGHYLLVLEVDTAPADVDPGNTYKGVCFYAEELIEGLKAKGSVALHLEAVDARDFPAYRTLMRDPGDDGFEVTTLKGATQYKGSTEPGFAILDRQALTYHTKAKQTCPACEYGVVKHGINPVTCTKCQRCDGTARATLQDGTQDIEYEGDRMGMSTHYLSQVLKFFGGRATVHTNGPLAVVVFTDGAEARYEAPAKRALIMPVRLD